MPTGSQVESEHPEPRTDPRVPHPAGEGTAADSMALAVWASAPGWQVEVDGRYWTARNPANTMDIEIHAPLWPHQWTLKARTDTEIEVAVTVPNDTPVSGDTFDGIVSALQGLGILP